LKNVSTIKISTLRHGNNKKVMLKQRFSIICDADFEFVEGQKEDMLDRLAAKLEKTRAELKLLFADLQTY
jgi:polyphosphate kinase